MSPCPRYERSDHVGITVADLDTVTAFFVGLGLEVEGRTSWKAASTRHWHPEHSYKIVMCAPPTETKLELSSSSGPTTSGIAAMANELGCATWPSK